MKMKIALLLFLGILCLLVSQSKSLKCTKKFLEPREKRYFNCLEKRIQEFFTKSFTYFNSHVDVPQHCRCADESLDNVCIQYFRSSTVDLCKSEAITEAFENYTNVFKEALKFSCKNNGTDFDTLEFPYRCYKHFPDVSKCQETDRLVTLTGKYSDSFCNKGPEILKCIDEALKKHNCNPVQQKTINEFYEALRNNTPCGKSMLIGSPVLI